MFKPKSVESILSVFTTAIGELNQLMEDKTRLITRYKAVAEEANTFAEIERIELLKAINASEKLNTLFTNTKDSK